MISDFVPRVFVSIDRDEGGTFYKPFLEFGSDFFLYAFQDSSISERVVIKSNSVALEIQ